jgi:proteasome lid subunit RPN8/RPN11
MTAKIFIPGTIKNQIIEQASRCFPEEACGIIAGVKNRAVEFIPVTNELHSPTRFRMDAVEQLNALLRLEDTGLDLLAITHSHPSGPDHPSQTDLEEFTYPNTIYLICTPQDNDWGIKAFRVDNHTYREVKIIS